MTNSATQTDQLDVQSYVDDVTNRARQAARRMACVDTGVKNQALLAIADSIMAAESELLKQNKKDMDAAQQSKLDSALLDRLALDSSRVAAMADGLRQIAALADPVGEISQLSFRPSGIQVGKMRVPLGVIAIIYESRPNVTADAAGLCLKSGNAAILRGGSEAIHSNCAIASCIQAGLKQAGLPGDAVQVINVVDRAVVGGLIQKDQAVDLIVPRGGKSLIERVSAEATVPVLKHLHGICHVYIDDCADIDMAAAIAFNAKTQRYGTCNTMETLLVAKAISAEVLPDLATRYLKSGVELRGCDATRALLPDIKAATAEDWDTEYLAPILSIRIVDDMEQAIAHIDRHGSGHTEAIVTEDYSRSRRFLREVDASSVMVNASTRFADGFEYGLGAEIGISTDKLHARGPVGLEGLTSQKFIVLGDGHIRK